MGVGLQRYAWVLLLAGGAFAQAELADPLPIWPKDGRIPKDLSGQYVFVTGDGHALVLLVPKDPDAGLEGPKRIVRMPLWNDLAPSLSVTVTQSDSGQFLYRYDIRNGTRAKDSIGTWDLIAPEGVYPLELVGPESTSRRVNLRGHPGATGVARHPLFPDLPPERYLLMWFYRDDNGIMPGETLRGFELYSPYQPGLTTALFSSGIAPTADQSWPAKVIGVALPQYWYRGNKFALTVGPVFPPETPAQERVARLQAQIQSCLKSGHLSASSEFVREAAEALRQFPHLTEARAVKARPANEIERAMAVALRFIPGFEAVSFP